MWILPIRLRLIPHSGCQTNDRVILPLIMEKISPSQTRIIAKTSFTTSRLPPSTLADNLHTSPCPIKPTSNNLPCTPSRPTIGRRGYQHLPALGAGLVQHSRYRHPTST